MIGVGRASTHYERALIHSRTPAPSSLQLRRGVLQTSPVYPCTACPGPPITASPISLEGIEDYLPDTIKDVWKGLQTKIAEKTATVEVAVKWGLYLSAWGAAMSTITAVPKAKNFVMWVGLGFAGFRAWNSFVRKT